MRLIGVFIWIILGSIILWFFAINQGQTVTIDFVKARYENVDLIVVIFITFFVGMIIGAIIISSYVVKAKSEVRTLKREQNKLLKELDGLRNMSIDELPDITLKNGTATSTD
jgi:uncharacterized integral membrane protein